MYAYPEGEKGAIDLVVKYNGKSITFLLCDWGKAFDPTLVPDVDVTLPAEKRRIGGLGIFLIRQMMDSVVYRRNENMNILIMSKSI